MNTAMQCKTHSTKSARNKNTHILRESEAYKNKNIEVLFQKPNHKFVEKNSAPKTSKEDELKRQAELRKLNNKINTYKKRLEVFQAQNNTKKITSLGNQIAELEKAKEKINIKSKGRQRTVDYVEFEFSFTKSNKYKSDEHLQQAIKRAVDRMQKIKIFKDLIPTTKVMHLDQYSLHIHLLNQLPDGKTWDSILQEQISSNKQFETGRDVYKHLQNTFLKYAKEEILKSGFKDAHRFMNGFKHQKGNKYTSLREYKLSNPLQNENIEESIELEEKELVEAPMSLEDRLELIKLKATKTAESEAPMSLEDRLELIKLKATKTAESKAPKQREKESKDHLAELIEKEEARTGIPEAKASNILNKKESESEEKAPKKRSRKAR